MYSYWRDAACWGQEEHVKATVKGPGPVVDLDPLLLLSSLLPPSFLLTYHTSLLSQGDSEHLEPLPQYVKQFIKEQEV